MARKLATSTKRKISLSQRGEKNSFYGKTHTPSTKSKISRATKGKNNPMFGKSHSAATKRKIGMLARQRAALRSKAKRK